MESAVVNSLSPGDEVLCVNGGKFGERWEKIATAYGMKVISFSTGWGQKPDLQEFEKQLKNSPKVKAVLTQACETSTATVFPVREMAALVHKHTAALMIVDAITAMGCMDLPMDAWGLDVVVAGSQKAFMLPAGIGFIGLSERAQKAATLSRCPKFYFDWKEELKVYPKTTRFSSPNSMIVALAEVLKIFETAGMAGVKNRCAALAEATRVGARELGLEVYSQSPSASVTALSLPSDVQGEKLRQWLEDERHITVMGGQDQLKGKVLRVGHMGAITDQDMMFFFEALAEGLQKKLPPHFEEKISSLLHPSEEYFL